MENFFMLIILTLEKMEKYVLLATALSIQELL